MILQGPRKEAIQKFGAYHSKSEKRHTSYIIKTTALMNYCRTIQESKSIPRACIIVSFSILYAFSPFRNARVEKVPLIREKNLRYPL